MNLKWTPSDSCARHFGRPDFFYKTKKILHTQTFPYGSEDGIMSNQLNKIVRSKTCLRMHIRKHAVDHRTLLRQVDRPTAAPPYSPPPPPNQSEPKLVSLCLQVRRPQITTAQTNG
jgi:hypothetical protein